VYYAWDIERFRKALDAGLEETFEGVPFTRAVVRVGAGTEVVCDVEPAETRAMSGPARIFGTPEVPHCLAGIDSYPLTCPPKTLFQAKGATIVGSDAVLGSDGTLYCPEPVETLQALDRALAFNATNRQAFVLQRETSESASICYFCSGGARHLDASALFLPNVEPGNYGSFVFRVLPQILLAAQLGIAFDVIVAADRSHWLIDAFRLANLPLRRILLAEESYGTSFRQVLFFNDFVKEGFFPTSTMESLALLARDVGAAEPKGALYVSRSLSRTRTPHYRPLTNERALEEQARDRGCTIVYPETLTFAEQIRLFASAGRIVGPSGSGMLNAAFARKGTRVLDLESFTVAVRQHAKIYASTGKDYAFAFGQFAGDDSREISVRSWRMPEAIFTAGLDWLFASLA